MKEIAKERNRLTYRKRRRRLAVILLPAALLGVAATSYVLLKSDQVVAAGIGCHDAPTDDSNVAIVSTTGEHPGKVCTRLWNRGDLGNLGPAPAMTACAGQGGAIHVFPSDDDGLCTRLGFQDLPDDYVREAKRFIAMRDAVVRRMFEVATEGPATEHNACLTQDQSLQIAEEVLEDHHFDDWTAEIAPGDYEGRQCANAVAFDDQSKKVLVIPTFQDEGIDPNPFGPH
ncbi:MAG TPA: hypothetical protein VHI54_02600 [Actinomycetota bacterium]|nr:hypothetical protein [Actinomycetota bacterium]